LKEFFSVWIFCRSFVVLKKRKKEEPLLGYLFKLTANLFGTSMAALEHYEWWQAADKLKQNGFYVDYVNGIISPVSITAADYDQASRMVTAFRKDARLLIEFCLSATEPQLKSLRKTLKTAAIKELLAESIGRSINRK
jgi:hypothetical protein